MSRFCMPPSYCWIRKHIYTKSNKLWHWKNVTWNFSMNAISMKLHSLKKLLKLMTKKVTACSVFYMNFTFWLIVCLCSALSREKCINTYIICLLRSSALWWNIFISQPLCKRWALLFSLPFLCTFKEEKDVIICSNELTWKHKEKLIPFSAS